MELLAKFHQIPCHQEFLLPNHNESREVAMEKVVHLSEIFKIVFCFKVLELGEVLFEVVKV
jgi:hypothetical protein